MLGGLDTVIDIEDIKVVNYCSEADLVIERRRGYTNKNLRKIM